MLVGDLIVFYGSLRPPYETRTRIGIESMVEWIGPARFRGALHDLGTYPAVVAGSDVVAGDLFRVVDDRLAVVLDPFEGFDPDDPDGSLYVREQIELVTPECVAWVYRHRGVLSDETLVQHGDWVAHLRAAGRSGTLGPDGGP